MRKGVKRRACDMEPQERMVGRNLSVPREYFGAEAKPAKKAKKDPNAPKRGLSAFMFFSQANRDSIKKKHPGCSFGEVGKYLGQEWAKAPAAVKAKHEAEAAKDKARYEAAMKKYKK